MNRLLIILTFLCVGTLNVLTAQQNTTEELSDEDLLKLYEDLRVADVSDGMDMVGLPDVGLMDQKIVALWKDIDDLSHQFRGIAITARYVPTNKVVRPSLIK